MSDCRFGVSPVNYPDPDPDPVGLSPILGHRSIMPTDFQELADFKGHRPTPARRPADPRPTIIVYLFLKCVTATPDPIKNRPIMHGHR